MKTKRRAHSSCSTWCQAFAFALIIAAALPTYAACPNPNEPGGTSPEGAVVYNGAYTTFQYCEGTDWIAMHAAGAGSGGCIDPGGVEGEILYNSASRVVQGCAGNTWHAFGPPGGAPVAFDPDNPNCVANEGGPFGSPITQAVTGTGRYVWSDGSHVFVAARSGGVHAYEFDGTSFTHTGHTYTGATDAWYLWGDGTYLYVADEDGKLEALSYGAGGFTLLDSVTGGSFNSVWGDGTYIYATNGNRLYAYSFDGSTRALSRPCRAGARAQREGRVSGQGEGA